jgi:hypothetical protein
MARLGIALQSENINVTGKFRPHAQFSIKKNYSCFYSEFAWGAWYLGATHRFWVCETTNP